MNESKVEKGITLIDLWIVLKKYWLQIVVLALVVALAAGILAYVFVKKTYTATAKIIINANNMYEVPNVSYANANKNYGISLYPSIKDMVTTTNKISSYIPTVDGEEFAAWCSNNNGKSTGFENKLKGTITCSHPDEESLIFAISYTTEESAENAVGTVNAIAYSLIKVSDTERADYDPETAKSAFDRYLYPFGGMLSPMQLATSATVAKSWKIFPILAAVLSFILLYVYFLLLSIFDDSVKSKTEIEEITGFNVIAFIEDISDNPKKRKHGRS